MFFNLYSEVLPVLAAILIAHWNPCLFWRSPEVRRAEAPPQQLGDLGESCKLPHGVWGGARTTNTFLTY